MKSWPLQQAKEEAQVLGTMLQYKAQWYRKNMRYIARFFPPVSFVHSAELFSKNYL
jgi:hypothetical protein